MHKTNLRSIFAITTFSSFMAKFCPIQFLKHVHTYALLITISIAIVMSDYIYQCILYSPVAYIASNSLSCTHAREASNIARYLYKHDL